MLAYLKGTVLYKSTTWIILEHHGVGYQIFLAPHQLEQLSQGSPAQFFTFEYVYEERRELYGFAAPEDLEFFFMLLEVQGVGPRSAQKIIAHAPVVTIKAAIVADDLHFLSSIPRLGSKTVGKIILELKPKLTHTKKVAAHASIDPDIEEALKRLGYSGEEINITLSKVPRSGSPEEKIKAALRMLKK